MAIQLYVIEGEELAKIHQKLDQLITAVKVLTEFKDTRLSKKWSIARCPDQVMVCNDDFKTLMQQI